VISALAEPSIDIKRFRGKPWKAQRTFETPLKDLHRFVQTLLSPIELEGAVLETDQIVFEPKNLLSLANRHSIPIQNQWEFALRADGKDSVTELLEAVLGDWVDFTFVPSPADFAIYADHDEYVTIYAPGTTEVDAIASVLISAGFKYVNDYERPYLG
jgi:hypothetical protein